MNEAVDNIRKATQEAIDSIERLEQRLAAQTLEIRRLERESGKTSRLFFRKRPLW